MIAWVLMSDHFHIILDSKENKPDLVIKRIKLKYSHQFRKINGLYRCKIWQARFWDHIIRNQKDFNRHIDYIHYNPVKHGYTNNPFNWEYSSIHNYRKDGYYSDDWGINEKIKFEGGFGE